MPSAHDGLPRTSFGGIAFPGETHTLKGVFRHHIHEYPHTPGGRVEKLGRALWLVTVRGNFQATFPAYPDLYPNAMNQLRSFYELGATLDLVHPTVGKFPAFIINWTQVKDAKLRSGEKVDIEFLEDQGEQFNLAAVVVSADDTAIGLTAARLAADIAAARADLTLTQNDTSVFDALQGAVSAVLAVQDTRAAYGNLYASKVEQVVSLCQQLDQATSLQDARAWPVVSTLQLLWQQALRIENDLRSRRVTLQTYNVPFTMPLLQVAINLFGDASMQGELLSLNADQIDNPLRVTAGTGVRYYPLTPQQQIANLSP